jgi:outer membrane autotransporter protein
VAHAYTETTTTAGGGAGVMGLSYNANTVTSLPTFLGAQLDTKYMLTGGHELTPFTRVSWVHEFETERQISASFTSVPGTGFTVDGARPSADAVRFESGGTVTLTRAASVFANLESEYSDRSRSYTGTAGVKVVW